MQNLNEKREDIWNVNGNKNHDTPNAFEENEKNSLKEILISKNLYPGQSSEALHEIITTHSHTEAHPTHDANNNTHNSSHGAHAVSKDEKQLEIMKFFKPLIFLLVVIILLLLSIAIVRYVPKAISSTTTYLSSVLRGNKVAFVSAPKEVASGEKIEFKWKNPSQEAGTYFWSFECTPGITVSYDALGGEKKPVVCNTSFPLPNTNKGTYGFYVSSNSASKITLPMTISFYDQKQEKLISSDTEKVSVIQKKKEATSVVTTGELYSPNYEALVATTTIVTTPVGSYERTQTNPVTKPTNTVVSAPVTNTTPAYYGNPDLSISLVQASVMNTGNTALQDISQAQYGNRILMRVRVTNTGTSPSGTWSVSTKFPTTLINDRNFVFSNQPSLRPGDVYEMTLGFDGFDGSLGAISLTLIGTNETNFANNTLLIPVPNTGTNNSYNYNYSTGRADLKVRILAVGTLNSYNNFRVTNNIDDSDTVGVRFEVENIGGESTGTFDIKAQLPNDDNEDYQIRNVASLNPGEKRVFTVGIEDPKRGKQKLTVEVDSNNDVREKSESNNTDSESIEIDN